MKRRPKGQRLHLIVLGRILLACLVCPLLLAAGCSNGEDSEDGLPNNDGQHEFPTYDDKPSLSSYFVAYENPVAPQASGYSLPLDLDTLQNYEEMNTLFDLQGVDSLLEQNGFAVLEYSYGAPWVEEYDDDIVVPYEYLRGMNVPIFVAADTLLHLYHVQFDETLKDLEEREFSRDIRDLTRVLLADALVQHGRYDGDLAEAARRNVAYLAVAAQLIDPESEIRQLLERKRVFVLKEELNTQPKFFYFYG